MATDKRHSLRDDGRAAVAETIKQQTYAQLVGNSSSLKASRASMANDNSLDAYNRTAFNLAQRRPRRASLFPAPANSAQQQQQQQQRPRTNNHDASVAAALVAHKRMSLDSIQHAAVSRRIVNEHLEAGSRMSYLDSISEFGGRPMWSNEQLRRARRFSSSHTRGASCPTLNITRIMRSISVSSGSSSSSSSGASSREGHSRALAKRARRHYSLAPVASEPESVVFRGESSSLHMHGSSSSSSNSSSSEHVRVPPRINVDGLRRRTAAGRHEAGTPDLVIQTDDLSSPLSPPLTEETYLDALYQLGATSASATPSISSATSSARWSTISAESPHKRYSYSSAAIAEALRNLQSAARHSNASLGEPSSYLYQSSTLPSLSPDPALLRADGVTNIDTSSADEKMTITLKGPPRRHDDAQIDDGSSEAASRGDGPKDVSSKSSTSGFKNFPRLDNSTGFLDGSSGRPSTEGMRSSGEAPIPAIYLDSTASLWDQYMAELDSSEFDSNIHLKRQRVSQFLRVPWNVERLLWFGVAICFDALIYVFSILPAKFFRAALTLILSIFLELPELVDDACSSKTVQLVLQALPDTWRSRVLAGGRRIQHWVCCLVGRRAVSDGSSGAAAVAGRNMSRWLSPAQLFDLYRGLLLIFTCLALCHIDAAQMYHSIRAQSSLKLYFIFSALDIFDRLLSSFGHDALDALQSTVTDPRSQRWKSGAGYFVLAQTYMLVHTLVLFYQVITLNVAVNAYSDQLLSLLISNQFVEIKSNVFKKWEKEMLFQVACADIAERFQEIVFLFIIILRNLAELSGTGISPLFDVTSTTASAPGGTATVLPTVQPPVSFDSATPSAFAPLIPTWISVPLINRIVTPILMVLGTEILIDWIKHAFITKLNWIRPEIYSHYIDILSRDLACSKSGVRARGVLPIGPNRSRLASSDALESSSDVDEKIEETGSSCGSSQARTRSSSSSSILTHMVLMAIAWVQTNLLSDSRALHDDDDDDDDDRRMPDSEGTSGMSAGFGRRRGHRRTQSVTQPQIFVEQSSRVARRIGLSPMPLACLITLMLMQVSYMLMQSSALHNGDMPLPSATEVSGLSWLFGWLMAVPVLSFFIRALAAVCKIVFSLLSLDALSYLGYLVVHPRKAMSSFIAMFFESPYNSLRLAAAPTGWVLLDVLGWAAIVLIAYALVVWVKLTFGNRLMQFAWNRYHDFERRTAENRGTESGTGNLKQFDDQTKKLDNNTFFEVGKLIAKEGSEAEWDKLKPKLTLDNIERYTLFKSRIP
ncbi:hypothetical protein J3B02_002887 [Coemansia erecta]|nr:hypothetical protein J3B02_002887 [Coemansia erecta]